MHSLTSKAEYDQLVEALANEFSTEIATGAARSVANHVIAAFEIHDGSPIVLDAVEYEGGRVETLDECLNPYDVLKWSDTERLPTEELADTSQYTDGAAIRASETLTIDLLDAQQSRRSNQGVSETA